MRSFVARQRPLLQSANVRFEIQGMVEAAEVGAGDVERDPRAGAGCALRRLGVRSAGLHFETQAVIDGVALAFINIQEDVFVFLGAVRIL